MEFEKNSSTDLECVVCPVWPTA